MITANKAFYRDTNNRLETTQRNKNRILAQGNNRDIRNEIYSRTRHKHRYNPVTRLLPYTLKPF